MSLPFTVEQFFETFAAYNAFIWPAQVALVVTALGAVYLAVRADAKLATIPPLLLAALWVWSGTIYHLAFFRRINPAAALFGGLFILQAALMVVATSRDRLVLRFEPSKRGWTGALLILYAIVLYPLAGVLLGHRYPSAPTFGAPCPLTIFTLGMLMWSAPKRGWYVFGIPLMWSAIGMSAALTLGVWEDLGLGVAGIVTLAFLFVGRSRAMSAAARAFQEVPR
jgi:hypothetical protein